MMQYEEAEAMVLKYLDQRIPSNCKPVKILKNRTEETSDSWVFFYDRVKTKDNPVGLAGNSPLEVSKKDGRIRVVPRNTFDALAAFYKKREEKARLRSARLAKWSQRHRRPLLMGYDLHITRAEFWSQNEGKEITADEWLKLVKKDPELKLAGYNGPYFALWNGPSQYPDPWLDWFSGNIFTKNPDDPIIEKMARIANQLGAKVQGDDGEAYVGGDQLNQLMWALQALAQPAEAQLALFPKTTKTPNKLRMDFERCGEWFGPDGQAPASGPAEGWEAVADLRGRLELMKGEGSDRLWTDDGLRKDRKWETVRKAAQRTLAAFKWPNQRPPEDWSR
jgi:hypothetical protein